MAYSAFGHRFYNQGRGVTIHPRYRNELQEIMPVQWLDAIEHARLRPGMYVGGTDHWALHYLVDAVIENSVVLAEQGQCSQIWITVQDRGSISIRDNGPGIPVTIYEKAGRPIAELVFTKAAGRFNAQQGEFVPTLFGTGLSTVNALSATLNVEIVRDGYVWQQEYKAGRPQTDLIKARPVAANTPTGTTITFAPDPTIFATPQIQYPLLAERCRDLAFLVKGLTINLVDQRENTTHSAAVFQAEHGLQSYVDYLREQHLAVYRPIYAKQDIAIKLQGEQPRTIQVELVGQYTTRATPAEESFANRYKLLKGRKHMYGLRAAFVDFINRFARQSGVLVQGDPPLTYDEVLAGLVSVVSMSNLHPHQTVEGRCDLPYPELQPTMYRFVETVLTQFSLQHPQDMLTLTNWIVGKRYST